MMNRIRIARTRHSAFAPLLHGGVAVADSASSVLALLRREFPAAWGMVLAEPRASGDDVDWWGEGLGNAAALPSLPSHEQTRLLAVLEERLGAIRALADRLPASDSDLAGRLRLATRYPDPGCVFSLAGQPAIIFWGYEDAAAAARAAMPPPAAATVATVATVGTVATTTSASGVWRRRAWPVAALAAVLMLAGVAGLLWWLHAWPFAARGDPQARLDQENERGRALEAELAELERKLNEARKSCPIPREPGAAIPAQPAPARPVPVPPARPVPPPPPAPHPEATPPSAQVPAPAPASPPETRTPEPPKPQASACPPPRKAWETPEVVFALDASGSMRLPYGMSDEEERALMAGLRRGDPAAMARAEQLFRAPSGNRRIDRAKQATQTAIRELPGDVDAGLIAFGECQGVDNFQFYKPSERGRMGGIVQSLQPRHGTPLARGIERAANMLAADDPRRPAVIVVLSDGEDTCGGDPCAMARALKARKPGLVINVVQVSDSNGAVCLAQATGGKVFDARNVRDIVPAVERATGQAPASPDCRAQ
jgi:hypothetical protein